MYKTSTSLQNRNLYILHHFRKVRHRYDLSIFVRFSTRALKPEGSPQLGPGGCLHVRDDGDVAGVDPEVGENLPHVLSLQVARHPPGHHLRCQETFAVSLCPKKACETSRWFVDNYIG